MVPRLLGVESAVELESVQENILKWLVAVYWYVGRALMNCLMNLALFYVN